MSKTEEFYKKAQDIVNSFSWLKVIFIGDAGTGKTSLIKSYYDVSVNADYFPTIGVDYGYKMVQSRDTSINRDIRVNIWDFSGDSDFLETRKELYTNTDIIVLVYDITNSDSFSNLHSWIREFLRYGNQSQELVKICVLGNKNDLDVHRRVEIGLGDKFAQSLAASHYETSARDGYNIKLALEEAIEFRIARKIAQSNTSQS